MRKSLRASLVVVLAGVLALVSSGCGQKGGLMLPPPAAPASAPPR